MSIPTAFLQDLIARSDIVQLISDRIALKKVGTHYKACCPFHQEKTPSFIVSEPRQTYHCFGCGEHGNVIGFLMAYDNMEFLQVVDYLASQHGLEVPQDNTSTLSVDTSLYDILQEANAYYQKQLRCNSVAIDYLKNRGLNGQVAKQFDIGFANDDWRGLLNTFKHAKQQQQLVITGMLIAKEDKLYDRFRHRIMIPIRDTRGRVIAFGGRALSNDNPPKYLNSPETPLFQKSKELFGLFEARMATRGELKRVVICEGYMDVIALFQFNITYAVATLGTASNAQHIYKLLRYTKEIIFCFDGDRAGRDAAWKALLNCLPLMHDGVRIHFAFLPDDEDPDSFVRRRGEKAFIALLDNAIPLSDFFFKQLLHGEKLDSVDNKASLGAKAITLINQIKPGIYQDLMKKQLGKLLNYDPKSITTTITHRTAKKTTHANTLNLIEKAIMLLLNNPEQAAKLSTFQPNAENEKILQTLIQIFHKNPNSPIGSLVTHFDNDTQHLLLTLSEKNIEIPKAEQAIELNAIVESLGQTTQTQIDQLLTKAKTSGLSDEEKHLLQSLFRANLSTSSC